jgi:hypothetical protein
VQLVGQFAHETQAHGTHEDGVRDHEFPVAGKGEGLVGKVDVHHLGQHLAGIGTGDVDHAHGVGQVDQVEIPVVETGVVANPLHGLPGPAGGGGEVVVVFTQLDHTPSSMTQPSSLHMAEYLMRPFLTLLISDTYTRCRAFERIGSVNAELAQGGGVQHAHVVAHVEDFFFAVESPRRSSGPAARPRCCGKYRHRLSGSHASGCA